MGWLWAGQPEPDRPPAGSAPCHRGSDGPRERLPPDRRYLQSTGQRRRVATRAVRVGRRSGCTARGRRCGRHWPQWPLSRPCVSRLLLQDEFAGTGAPIHDTAQIPDVELSGSRLIEDPQDRDDTLNRESHWGDGTCHLPHCCPVLLTTARIPRVRPRRVVSCSIGRVVLCRSVGLRPVPDRRDAPPESWRSGVVASWAGRCVGGIVGGWS